MPSCTLVYPGGISRGYDGMKKPSLPSASVWSYMGQTCTSPYVHRASLHTFKPHSDPDRCSTHTLYSISWLHFLHPSHYYYHRALKQVMASLLSFAVHKKKNLRLSSVLQVVVQCRVHLEDAEGVFQRQGIRTGDRQLSERLHESIGTEVEVAERRQEDNQLSSGREGGKSMNFL